MACSSINNGHSSPVSCSEFKDAIVSSCRPGAAILLQAARCSIATSIPSAAATADRRRGDRRINAITSRTNPAPVDRSSDPTRRRSGPGPGPGRSGPVRAHHITEEIITGGHLLYARHAASVVCHRRQLFVVLINRKIINTLDGAAAFFPAPSGHHGDIFPNARRINSAAAADVSSYSERAVTSTTPAG